MHTLCRTVALFAFALAAAACHRTPGNRQEATLPAAQVRASVAESKARPATEEAVGTVRAKLRAAIEPKVSGRIESMLVTPGQVVKTGDLLARLDGREFQARLDQAIALREQARSDFERQRQLLGQKITTQAEFDAAKARMGVAEANASEAETMLAYRTVSAPFAGTITRKLADVGDLATPGKPIVEIEDQTGLRLEADLPEALVAQIKLGDTLSVSVPSAGAQVEGVVSEISPVADPVSRTFLTKLDLQQSPALRAGQFGRVAVPVGESTAARVPAAAVVRRGQMEYLFVVASDHARLRIVKTGRTIGNEVEIVSGLDAGERFVTEGAAALADGQPLNVQP
ncbi:MAG: efflux RND transporter periplasmic adaptor subunit [Chthoniobacteraceae bacterium]